jgi:phospho-N-acetylmuramoyl-pentapeptide-transferase
MMDNIRFIMDDNNYLPVLVTFLTGLLVTAIITPVIIPILKKYKAKQTIHEDVPQNHRAKAGTPTMGGIAILIGTVLASICVGLWSNPISTELWVILVAFILFGLLGFVDDYHKVINKRNLGLTARQKLLIQCTISLIVSVVFVFINDRSTEIQIPFTTVSFDMGYFYILFMTFAIVAMVNSVNLTDGLDGLAAGVSLIVCLFLGLASVQYSAVSSNWFILGLAGACAGFLIFNKNPAKIFMGDTGSLALGGGISVAAFYADMEIIMIIVGFVYVLEALSDIIQVASYKLRNGKRVFKMAPLHHHFELVGWSERKIVGVFMAVTLILCLISSFSI